MLFPATCCYYWHNLTTAAQKSKQKIRKYNIISIGYFKLTFYDSIIIERVKEWNAHRLSCIVHRSWQW